MTESSSVDYATHLRTAKQTRRPHRAETSSSRLVIVVSSCGPAGTGATGTYPSVKEAEAAPRKAGAQVPAIPAVHKRTCFLPSWMTRQRERPSADKDRWDGEESRWG